MKCLNQVTLLGNLTRDPELRYTSDGKAVIGFSIATNRQWTMESGEKKEATDYHDIVFWGKAAEIINQFVHKGTKILVQGRLQTRSWEKEGQKRYKTEIVGDDFVLFDKMTEPVSEKPTEEPTQEVTKKEEAEVTKAVDEIPF